MWLIFPVSSIANIYFRDGILCLHLLVVAGTLSPLLHTIFLHLLLNRSLNSDGMRFNKGFHLELHAPWSLYTLSVYDYGYFHVYDNEDYTIVGFCMAFQKPLLIYLPIFFSLPISHTIPFQFNLPLLVFPLPLYITVIFIPFLEILADLVPYYLTNFCGSFMWRIHI